MIGIIVDDFNLLLKKNNSILDDLNSDVSSLRKSSLNLTLNFNKNDLSFLNKKLNLELNQIANAINKINGYQNVLNSIYISYQKQLEQVVIDTKKLMS